MQLYCCGETAAAERHAITGSWWWLISSTDSWHCSGFSLAAAFRSPVCQVAATYVEHLRGAVTSCSVLRSLWFFESHWSYSELKCAFQRSHIIISYQKQLQSCPVSVLWHHSTSHYNTVPEMVSELSGFRALASCDYCKRGSVRLVLWCQLSGIVELFLNRNPSPWDMRNLEIEVWMSVQCYYNQGRRSLSNEGYTLKMRYFQKI